MIKRENNKKIKAGIIGGAGYGGAELIKLLVFHPQVSLDFVTSRRFEGMKVSSINRHLSEVCDLRFVPPDVEKLPSDTDIVFLAAPHGVSMSLVPRIAESMPGARIIDLSGDFRLRDPELYKQYYNKEHQAPWLVESFVYGLAEFNREAIAKARYVANPGCFATGIIFALFPFYRANAVKRDVAVVAVTGSSGSGESPKEVTHHPVRAKNFKSYKILEHQHAPEIEQFFTARFTDQKAEIGFIPQSGPFIRGIYTTAVVFNPDLSRSRVEEVFHSVYENQKFVRIVDQTPEVATVCGTNYVEVSWVCKKGFMVGMSAIDNLVRGASGQAVQNMNIMFGFRETLGLEFPGMRP